MPDVDPIYPKVRQWLQQQRQANGGQLTGLGGDDSQGVPWLLLLAIGVGIWLVMAGQHRREAK